QLHAEIAIPQPTLEHRRAAHARAWQPVGQQLPDAIHTDRFRRLGAVPIRLLVEGLSVDHRHAHEGCGEIARPSGWTTATATAHTTLPFSERPDATACDRSLPRFYRDIGGGANHRGERHASRTLDHSQRDG